MCICIRLTQTKTVTSYNTRAQSRPPIREDVPRQTKPHQSLLKQTSVHESQSGLEAKTD